MKLVIRHRLRSFEPGVADVNLKFVGQCDWNSHPTLGTFAVTGMVSCWIIQTGYHEGFGFYAIADDKRELHEALGEVKNGLLTFEQVVAEFLASGWQLDDGSEWPTDPGQRTASQPQNN